jgi:hypothetical protein
MGHIAWSFTHAESVDPTIRNRFARLWDVRFDHVRTNPKDSQELNDFYWIVASGKFDTSWWLPRLKEAAELAPELAHGSYTIGKQVADASETDPRGALEATRELIRAHSLSDPLPQNALPIVLARAIGAGDQRLKRDAIQFMNELGEKGDLGLEKAVNEVLSGKITQVHVDNLNPFQFSVTLREWRPRPRQE